MVDVLTVKAVVETSDRAKRVEVDASDWIRECDGDSFLLDHWDMGFRELASQFEWMDYDDDPGVVEVLEHLWAAKDQGLELDVSCEIEASQVMPFIEQHMPKYYVWMTDWIRKLGGDPGVLPS